MSIMLELTPQEEELVRNAARESGKSIEVFLKERAFRGLTIAVDSESGPEGETMWDRLTRAGEAAGHDATSRAHALGLGVVYAKEGAVVEELPGGTIRVLYPAIHD